MERLSVQITTTQRYKSNSQFVGRFHGNLLVELLATHVTSSWRLSLVTDGVQAEAEHSARRYHRSK
jgi:hypothetical protein